ncbi:MAG: DMT family transporter [Clostridia bacterium]|nr:DMT family transporter [Clostridia bacterium]
MQKTSLVVGLAVLANMLWGSAAPIIKIGYGIFQIASDDIASQILFAGIRFFLAGILALTIGSIISGKVLVPSRSSVPKICILALFQTIIQYVFFYMGCAHTTGTKVTIVSSTGAFISILFSSLLFHQEKLTAKKILGCVLGFAGVLLINLGPGGGLDLNISLAGEGAILLSTCAYSLSGAFTKAFSKTENPVMLCGYQFILGGGIMIGAAMLFGGQLPFVGLNGIVVVLYLASLSAIAFSITSLLYKYNPVSRVSVFSFMNPIFGVTLSILILNESGQEFGMRGIIALALVCLGVFAVNYSKKKQS